MEKNTVAQKSDAYAVLKIKDFRFFVTARFLFTFGIQMQSVIVGWQVYMITKDALALGLIGLSEAIPFLCIALLGGYVADRYNRKKIMILANSVYLLCAFALFLLTFRFGYIFHTIGVLPIYIIIFITGFARGFIFPAQTALMAQLVPRELYTNSSTWNSSFWHIAAVSGPAAGGLIYGFWGISAAYLTVVISVTISLISVFFISSKPITFKKGDEKILQSLKIGIKYVLNHQIILSALTLDMLAVLFGGAVALLPIFADVVLKVGPQGLGLLRAAPAAGAVIMAFILAHHPPNRNTGKKLLFAISGFGICIIIFALSKNFYLSLIALMFSGIFDNVSVIIRATIIQLFTPDEMRGRVASVNSIFIGSSNEIGSFESGLAAKIMGLIPSVIFGGCMTLTVVGITARFAPMLRKLHFTSFLANK